MPIGVMKSCK